MSEAAKRRKRVPPSDETRAKFSEAAKRAWKDKDITERRLAAIREAKADGEHHERMSRAASDSRTDPEIRERRIAAIRAAYARRRAKCSTAPEPDAE
jgi:anti-sigma28 factor (negative regulator of flagellin synthesis)